MKPSSVLPTPSPVILHFCRARFVPGLTPDALSPSHSSLPSFLRPARPAQPTLYPLPPSVVLCNPSSPPPAQTGPTLAPFQPSCLSMPSLRPPRARRPAEAVPPRANLGRPPARPPASGKGKLINMGLAQRRLRSGGRGSGGRAGEGGGDTSRLTGRAGGRAREGADRSARKGGALRGPSGRRGVGGVVMRGKSSAIVERCRAEEARREGREGKGGGLRPCRESR